MFYDLHFCELLQTASHYSLTLPIISQDCPSVLLMLNIKVTNYYNIKSPDSNHFDKEFAKKICESISCVQEVLFAFFPEPFRSDTLTLADGDCFRALFVDQSPLACWLCAKKRVQTVEWCAHAYRNRKIVCMRIVSWWSRSVNAATLYCQRAFTLLQVISRNILFIST